MPSTSHSGLELLMYYARPARAVHTLDLTEWFTIPMMAEVFREPASAMGLLLNQFGFRQGKVITRKAYADGAVINVDREYQAITRWNARLIMQLVWPDRAENVVSLLVPYTEVGRSVFSHQLVDPDVGEHLVIKSPDVLCERDRYRHVIFWNKLDAAKYLLLQGRTAPHFADCQPR